MGKKKFVRECECIEGGWIVVRRIDGEGGSTLLLMDRVLCIGLHTLTHKIRGMENYTIKT